MNAEESESKVVVVIMLRRSNKASFSYPLIYKACAILSCLCFSVNAVEVVVDSTGIGTQHEHKTTTTKVEQWAPVTNPRATVQDLHREYQNIFRHGNRNAASHLWSTFLLDRSDQMTESQLILFFSGFCAVSGSPVRPSDFNRYRLTLPMVPNNEMDQQAKQYRTGYMHYCCWPCVCDTQDFIRVDTKTIMLKDGPKEFTFATIGDPCDHPEELTKPFVQPFYGREETTIEKTAPEVRCNRETGFLEGTTLSDNGYIIISMFFDSEDAKIDQESKASLGLIAPGAQEALADPKPGRMSSVMKVDTSGRSQFQDEREYKLQCENRAKNGYNSGMGEIFRKVSAISPIPVSSSVEDMKLPSTGDVESSAMEIEVDDLATIDHLHNKSGDTNVGGLIV